MATTPLDPLRQLTSQRLGIPPQDISQRAHQLYLATGQVEGHSLEHWLEAERQLIAEYLPRPVRLRPEASVSPAPSARRKKSKRAKRKASRKKRSAEK